MIYDIIIIGAGPGGISAAIYAKRSGLKVLVLESKMLGGLINYTNIVDNYPGFPQVTGPKLAEAMLEHFNSLNIEIKYENVVDLILDNDKKVITNKGEYLCKNVIIATGRMRRSLNVPGEKDLRGGGISYCAMCDGHFYKDKDVIVVGAGDSALEEAIYLSKIVKSVTMLVRGKTLTGAKSLIQEVEQAKNINIIYNVTIEELLNKDNKLTGVRLNSGKELTAEGIFVYIGFDPILPFKSDIGIEREKGYILVKDNFETNIPGVYAIGDIIKKELYQIISAEYEGARAATDIARKLTKHN